MGRIIVAMLLITLILNSWGDELSSEKPYILLLSNDKSEPTGFGGSISTDGLNFTTWKETSSGYVKLLWTQKSLDDLDPVVKEKRSIPSVLKVPNDSNHCSYSLGSSDSNMQAYYFDMLSGKGNSLFDKELIKNNKIGQSCISFCHEKSKSFMGIWWDSESFNGHVYIYQDENGLTTLKPDKDNPDADTNIYDMSCDGKIILLKIEKTDSFYAYFKEKDRYQKLANIQSGHISPNGNYICAVSAKDESKYLTRWKLKDASYELEKSYSDKYESIDDVDPIVSSPSISDNGDIAANLITAKGNISIIIFNDMKSPCMISNWIKSIPDFQWDKKLPVKQIRKSLVRGISFDERGVMILIDIVDNEKSYPAKIFLPKVND